MPFDDTESHDEYGSVCVQDRTILDAYFPNTTMSEDCLFLNVFAPSGASDLPVMFYIHGGGYTQGFSQQLSMDKIARDYGVVGVNVNYRLGALGFFSDEELEKEYGASGGANGGEHQLLIT